MGCIADDTFSKARSWFESQAEKQAKNDSINSGDFVGAVFSIIVGVLILLFFLIHLTRPTGFFTSSFGTFGAILFFLIAVYEFIPQFIRILTRKKSTARPYEIAGAMLVLIAIIYFLATFPFDFTHFSAPLPTSLEFLLNWVSNGFATALMVAGLVALVVAIPVLMIQWIYLKRALLVKKVEISTTPQPPGEETDKKTE